MTTLIIRFNYLNQKNRRLQIESLSEMIFNAEYEEEIFKEYGDWRIWITNIFLPLIDTEKGDFRFLPYEGTILDQGFISMAILYVIQSTYRRVQNDKIKRMKA